MMSDIDFLEKLVGRVKAADMELSEVIALLDLPIHSTWSQVKLHLRDLTVQLNRLNELVAALREMCE